MVGLSVSSLRFSSLTVGCIISKEMVKNAQRDRLIMVSLSINEEPYRLVKLNL